MFYVYIIKSLHTPNKFYVGCTLDILSRLEKHNEGGSVYTSEHKPWELVWHCEFKNKQQALEF